MIRTLLLSLALAGCGPAAQQPPATPAPPAANQAAAAPAPAAVPAASAAPRLDGKIEPDEWRGARALELGRGQGRGRALVQQQGRTLFVAVDGGGKGISTLLILRGDRMYALHASAALATGIYVRDADGSWRREQDFQWQARDSADEEARAKFRRESGWLSNVAPRDADREFAIDLDALAPADAEPAFVFVRYADEIDAWPADVQDDSVAEGLQQGALPERIRLEPSRWGRLQLRAGP
jgi:hypothetical protein